MNEPYLSLDTEHEYSAFADCGCALRESDDGAVIRLDLCPLHAAAPALAEALRVCVDYYTQAGIGACAEGHDDDDDETPFSGDERYNVRHARAALKQAGIEE